ncbi:unnamed protein product [Camellia sinensis]
MVAKLETTMIALIEVGYGLIGRWVLQSENCRSFVRKAISKMSIQQGWVLGGVHRKLAKPLKISYFFNMMLGFHWELNCSISFKFTIFFLKI